MPSGRTHDRITLWSLPLVMTLSFRATADILLTLIVSSGFLFGGFMFGPDLDIHSVQYRRWGWFRWIWLPYRGSMRHRSILSHGRRSDREGSCSSSRSHSSLEFSPYQTGGASSLFNTKHLPGSFGRGGKRCFPPALALHRCLIRRCT